VVGCLPFKRDERLGDEDDDDNDNDVLLIGGRGGWIHLDKRAHNDGFASKPADAGSVKFDFAAGFADLVSDSLVILYIMKKNLLLRALLCMCVRVRVPVALMMLLLLPLLLL
jgi:hypothetical protein